MEFWGVEVKPGQTLKVQPENDYFLHLSQAALGEFKKDTDKATMYAKVDNQKLSIGTLSTDKFPQIQFDLVFDKVFELTHTSKTSSVFFSGYKVLQPVDDGEEMDFDSEGSEEEEEEKEEEKIVPVAKENGKADGKQQKRQVKIDAAPSKSKAAAKDVGKSKNDDGDDSDESDASESESDDDGLTLVEGDSDNDLSMGSSEDDDDDDDDDEEDDSSDEDEETPKKQETGKKRAAEVAPKTPASDKKAKLATPSGQKTGEKKGAVHVATPHPAKKAGKTPATTDKSPKSGGSVTCKSCSRTFNSEMALNSHSKAKHEGK